MTTKERRIGEWLLEKKEEIKGEREVFLTVRLTLSAQILTL